MVALGVILHATFDYPNAANPQAPEMSEPALSSQMLAPIEPELIYVAPLEVAAPNAQETALRAQAGPVILFALLIVVIAVFLRLAFSQTEKRSLAPVVAVVVLALVVLGAYMMRHPDGLGLSPAMEAVE
ncbi:hypothetical protein OEG86_25565 [Hoeflea alexandrii]|uniref:hypothetical protein n=1 Tax=Hoeflea alexandrii TaxID=288436 RepID=UPI00227078BC|nr:hypothetical protein [Hoeflea alexandrii]MCY0155021.1 hypothetical protein [Hoeflea alexandrii]